MADAPKVTRARFATVVPIGAIETMSVTASKEITLTRTDGGLRIEQAKKKPLWVPAANLRWVEYEA